MARHKSTSSTKEPKDEACVNFSRYIRVRDCIETTGTTFLGRCITCGKQYHIAYLDAGHFNSGRRNSVLFQEQGCHAQCGYCNQIKHSDPKKYREVLIEKYGKKTVLKLEAAKKVVIQDADMDFEGLAEKYDKKYKEMMRSHGHKTWLELLGQTRD